MSRAYNTSKPMKKLIITSLFSLLFLSSPAYGLIYPSPATGCPVNLGEAVPPGNSYDCPSYYTPVTYGGGTTYYSPAYSGGYYPIAQNTAPSNYYPYQSAGVGNAVQPAPQLPRTGGGGKANMAAVASQISELSPSWMIVGGVLVTLVLVLIISVFRHKDEESKVQHFARA